MDVLHWIDTISAALPAPIAWLLAGGFALVESGLGLGFFFPGETVVLILAATMPTWSAALGMFLAVIIGASAGDHIGYFIGRHFGPRMRGTKVIRKIGVANWDRAVGVVERRGAAAVFLTRLVPVIRTLTPAVAGVAGLPYRRFLPASLAGAATWSAVYVGVGFALHASWEAAEALLGQYAPWALLAAGVVIAVVFGVRAILHRRRRDASTSAESALEESALEESALEESVLEESVLDESAPETSAEPASDESDSAESRQLQTTP